MVLKLKKKLTVVLLAVLTVALAFIAAFSLAPENKAYAYTNSDLNSKTAINIEGSGSYKFDRQGLNALAKELGYVNINHILTATRNESLASKTTRVVQLGKDNTSGGGALKWAPVYLSHDTSGNVILTLWLATDIYKSTWSDGTYGDGTKSFNGKDIYCNTYDGSFIRHKLNGKTGWTTNWGEDKFGTQNNDIGTMVSDFYGSGKYASFITKPANVTWQKDAAKMKNDPKWNGSNSANYPCDWINDNVWLPSMYEVYDVTVTENSNFFTDNGGLWCVNSSLKQSDNNAWLRSGYFNYAKRAFKLNSSGDYGYAECAVTLAVRPALHLNLTAAAEAAEAVPEGTYKYEVKLFNKTVLCETIDEAWTVANSVSSATVKLLADAEISSTLEVSDGKTITLDLNGKELKYMASSGSAIKVSGTTTNKSYFILTDSEKDLSQAQKTEHTVNGYKIKGGLITGGKYGGVQVNSNGAFTMEGGTIAGNTSGVYVNGGTFTMNDGTISYNNTSSYGGGVYVKGTFRMLGGEISHNSAQYGGGVYGSNSTTLTIMGKITDNTATTLGGGVYARESLFVGGTVKISGNKKGQNADNVYLSGTTSKIRADSGDNKLAVEAEIYVNNTGEVITNFTAANRPQNTKLSDIFKPDDPKNNCIFISDETAGNVTIGVHTGGTAATCKHKAVCGNCQEEYGDVNPDNHTYENGTCKDCGAAASFVVIVGNGEPVAKDTFVDAWNYATENSSAEISATVKMCANATITSKLIVDSGKNIILDLNGYKLALNASTTATVISVSGTFTLDDSTKNLLNKNTHDILVESKSVEIKGGVITGGTSSGVSVSNGGIFTMEGGTIAGNTATFGGGVLLNGATFTMKDGAISHNSATSGGGGVYVRNANDNFTMEGGTIENNVSKSLSGGGGMYLYGTLKISGNPKIRNNVMIRNDAEQVNNITLYNSNVLIEITGKLTADAEIYLDNRGAVATGFTAENRPQGAKPSDIFKHSNTNYKCVYVGTDGSTVSIDSSHNYYNVSFTVDVEPTCTENGSKSKHCANCGEKSEITSIPASHTLTAVAQVNKTCTTDGVLAHDHCTVCNNNFIGGVEKSSAELVIPAGHTLSAVAQVDKTCTTDGKLAHDHCSVCNKDFIDGAEKSADDLKIAAGHTLSAVAQVDKTCTTDGVLAHDHCSVCNKDFIDGVEKTAADLKIAASHTLTAVEQVDKTCTADGVLAHDHCSVCNKDFISGVEKSANDLKIAAGHTLSAVEQVDKTCTQDGVLAHDHCSVCGKDFISGVEKSANDLKIAAGHTLTSVAQVNQTCSTDGVLAHDHCSVCNKDFISGVEKTAAELKIAKDGTSHSWDDGIITTPATCSQEGVRTYTCTHNNEHTKTEAVPKDDNAHSFATDWTKDATGHWHAATCEHSSQKSGYAAHTASEWIVDTAAQIGVAGRKHKECTVCGYEMETAEIPAIEPGHEHTFSTEWTKDETGHWHAATCDHISQKSGFAAHTAGEWIIDTPAQIGVAGRKHKECTVCGYEMETAEIPALEHEHTYSTGWTNDGTGHWHAATCEHTTEKGNFAAHTAGEWIVDTAAQIGVAGRKHKECTVCGYEMETAEIPAIEPGHEHTFSTDWTKDETGHWHAATCEHISQKSEFAEHTEGEWIVDTPAQIGVAGSKHKECTVCGFVTETETIPALKSELKKFDENGDNQVIVTTSDGFAHNVELVVTEITKDNYSAYDAIAQTVNGEIGFVYDVTLKTDGVVVQPDGTLTIKLRIPEKLKDKTFKLFHMHEGTAAEMEYTVDGGYAVISTDKLSEIIFIGEKIVASDANGVWIALIIIMCVIILGEAGYLVYRYVFKKKRTEGKQ